MSDEVPEAYKYEFGCIIDQTLLRMETLSTSVEALVTSIDTLLASIAHSNDSVFGAIESTHHMIHIGKRFSNAYNVSKDNGETADVVLEIPADTDFSVHLSFSFSGTGIFTIGLYEDTAEDGDGVAFPLYNLNRLSSNVSRVTASIDPTVTDPGTLIKSSSFGSTGVGNTQIGGQGEARFEIMCKRNTKYLIRSTSGGNDNILSIQPDHYEFDF